MAPMIAAKASAGLSLSFPDVCKTPGASGVPIPYPNIATTAQKKQALKQQKVAGTALQQGFESRTSGNDPGTMKGLVTASSSSKNEIGQLKSGLSTLNLKLQSLPAKDPNAWQAVLTDYLVLASALYLAQSDD